jgi:multidrug efflux system outer membrane protein
MRSRLSPGPLRLVLAALSTVSVMAGGCMVGPKYARPPVEEPALFKSGGAGEPAPSIPTEWWRLYSDPELDQLIATAHASNQTLRQAVARVDQARALARVAGSFLYPTISFDPSFAHTRYSGNRRSTITGQKVQSGQTLDNFLIPFDLTYEIDVWGRVRRSFESARAQAAASADDLGVVRLTVETDVAQYYYALRSLDAQAQILTETVVS